MDLIRRVGIIANTIIDEDVNKKVLLASLLAKQYFFICRHSALARVVSDRRSLTCIAEVRFENAFMDFRVVFIFRNIGRQPTNERLCREFALGLCRM